MLEQIKEIFGCGSISAAKMTQSHHKQRWNYYACSKLAESIIRQVRPYLVAKGDQADLALLSRKYIRKHGINTANPDMVKQAEIREQIMKLH